MANCFLIENDGNSLFLLNDGASVILLNDNSCGSGDGALSVACEWIFSAVMDSPTRPQVVVQAGAGGFGTLNGPTWKTWWEDTKAWEDEKTFRRDRAVESPEYKRLKRKLRMLEDSREWATRKSELEARIKEVMRQIEALERG